MAKVFGPAPRNLVPIAGGKPAEEWRQKLIAAGQSDAVADAQACIKRMTGSTAPRDEGAITFFWNQLVAENKNDVEAARRKLWNAAYARICKKLAVPDANSTAGRDYLKDS